MDTAELRDAAGAAIDVLAGYAERSTAGEGPAVTRRPPAAVMASLDLHRLVREGGLDARSFGPWLERYLADSTRLQHPGELAHQVGVPDVGSALADIVHGVANQPMSIYEMGAAAAAVELTVLEWMVEKVGWDPASGGGVLTHGGSLANLTALLAARAKAAPDAWGAGVPGDLAILAPPSAHYSIARAVGILGLGVHAIVPLEVDALERVRVDRLPDGLDRARAAGRRPMALVAGACATGTGLHDDLRGIGVFCREHGIWLHVDAAHGASALLSERLRGLLDGIELADSVVWDAHKMLRTSALCAAVLVRRRDDLPAAFEQSASYLDFDNPHGVDAIDRQVECTKSELALKLFLNLAFCGERGLADYVEEQYAKTLALWARLAERPGFHAPYRPESNILCFRFGPAGARQAAIREALLAAGEFHLSSAEIAGERHLRVAVMSPATDERTFDELLDAIEAVAQPTARAFAAS
ncbi:MAG TPA: pyridoxal-dependent decarboxylase [Solirubrobacteraceae bacterium]|nr:pyridoxal-dependent decarboxylase [Solirubrobacteraceae bacterium]